MSQCNWITDKIFTVSEFFTPAECATSIELAEAVGFKDAPITTAFGPRLRKEVRNNTRVMIDDHELARKIWQRSSDYVPRVLDDACAIGVNERFRYYRYDVGQQFNWHFDGAFERPNGDRSQLTFMIYLNDGFEGGETSFEDAVVVPKTGTALFFIHQIRHKGEPVTKGRKYVLRTDVMYRWPATVSAHS